MEKNMDKMLIVYYSWSNGNTEKIAKQLQEATGSDIVQIEMVEPYTGTYNEVVEQGKEEVNHGVKPTIRPLLVNWKDYDTVAVGTPTWWYTMAPAMASFLSSQDWRGKTVIPFMTNGGWPGNVIEDIKKSCQGAKFTQEMEVRFDSNGGSHMETAESDIEAWIMRVKQNLLR